MNAAIKRLDLAAFASGRGSNFAAIIAKIHTPGIYGRIRVLLSDNPAAYAIGQARAAGIPVEIISYKEGRQKAEADIRRVIAAYSPDLLVLCGFMRLLSSQLVGDFPNRILNIHPSLLPAFPGLDAQRQALAYGVKLSGCTVHIVDEGMDTGTILLQDAVPVLDGDTPEILSARILAKEHELFPRAIEYAARHWPLKSKNIPSA